MYSENDKKLAHDVCVVLFEKMDYEKFLDVFGDKYNWFAFLGVDQETYDDLSLKISTERDEHNKQKVLAR